MHRDSRGILRLRFTTSLHIVHRLTECVLLLITVITSVLISFDDIDAVGWAAGRASGL